MDEIVIKLKKSRKIMNIVSIMILGLMDIIMLVVMMIAIQDGVKWYGVLFCTFCILGTSLFINMNLEELIAVVKITGEHIYIRYDRKHSADEIITCEYACDQNIEGTIKGDTITLKYDQKHFVILNERQWTNFDALLFFIVNNKINVTTDYPEEFAKVRKRFRNSAGIKGYVKSDIDEERELSVRERILIVVSTCAYIGLGSWIIYLAMTESVFSLKSIMTFIFGIIFFIVGLVCPFIFKKRL